MEAHARATVDRAVRRGRLPGQGQGLGTGVQLQPSKAKKNLDKRIGKSVPQLQAIVERIQRVRNDTADEENEGDVDQDDPLTSHFGP